MPQRAAHVAASIHSAAGKKPIPVNRSVAAAIGYAPAALRRQHPSFITELQTASVQAFLVGGVERIMNLKTGICRWQQPPRGAGRSQLPERPLPGLG